MQEFLWGGGCRKSKVPNLRFSNSQLITTGFSIKIETLDSNGKEGARLGIQNQQRGNTAPETTCQPYERMRSSVSLSIHINDKEAIAKIYLCQP